MRKNRTKHEAKKPRLAKRALALCFALIFVCSCLLPVFAHSEENLFTQEAVEQQDEQPTDSALLNEGGANPTEEPKPVEPEQKQEEPNASKETQEEPANSDAPGEPASSSSASSDASDESQSTAPGDSASSSSASTAPGESASSSSASSEASGASEQPASSETKTEQPASSESKPTTNTTGDTINQGEAVYTYRFWTKEIDAFDLEQVNLAVNNGENLTAAAKSVTGIAPCEVLKVANHAHLADYTVAEPTKDGYEFAGWYTLENGTAYEFSFDQNVSFEESKTIDVFAKWEKVESTVEDEMEKTEPTTEDELDKTEPGKANESKEETLSTAEGAVGLTNNEGDTVSIAVKAENLPGKVSELVVTDLNDDDEGEAFESAFGASSYTDWNVTNLMVNITPKDAEGNTVEPNGAVTVHFSGLESLMIQYSSEMNLKVLHMKRDGTLEALSLKNVQTKETQEGTVLSSFAVSTTSFSPFVLAADVSTSVETVEELGRSNYRYGKTLTRGESIVVKAPYEYGRTWKSSDSSVLEVVDTWTSNDGYAYARIKAHAVTDSVTVSYNFSDHPWWKTKYSSTFAIENNRGDQQADIFFLKTPNTGADSNSKGYWLPTDGNEDWTVNGVQFEGKINTAGAKWDSNNKNIMLTDRDNATGTYVLSWPDGSKQKTWTLYKNCTDEIATAKDITDKQTNQVAFSTILNMIWDAYKEELAKDLKVDASTLDKEKITEITLIPYKISTNDTMHIDCTISATGLAYQARFWVEDAESSSYVQVYGKNYNRASKDEVAKPTAAEFQTWMTTNNVSLKGQARALPENKTVNGVTYRFDGWYRENTSNDALPDETRKIGNSFPVAPTDDELQNDVVNFFARYVPVDTEHNQDQSYIIVEKEVKGLTDVSQLPKDFCITVGNNEYDLNSRDGDIITNSDGSGFKIRWKIDVGAGNHKVGESHYTVNGYNVVVKVNDEKVTNPFTSTNVNVTPKTIGVSHGKVITPNSDSTFDFGVVGGVDHIFAVSIIGSNQRNIIISKEPLSVSQRAAVVKTLKELGGNGSNFSQNANAGKNEFYSLKKQDKIVVAEGVISYNAANNKVTISAKSTWNKVVGMSYSVEEGNNPEVSITNTYTPATTSLTVTKATKKDGAEDHNNNTDFNFTLTLGEKSLGATWTKGSESGTINKTTHEFTLKGGESITFSGIRLDDTNVKVEEIINDNHYTTTNTVDSTASPEGKVANVTPKSDGNTVVFTNAYTTPKLPSMTIQKVVTGAFGERTKAFNFSVTLNHTNPALLNDVEFTGVTSTDSKESFTLKHGQHVTLGNIPINTTITITETDANDYKTSATGHKNSIKNSGERTFTYKVVDEGGKAVLKSVGTNSEGFDGSAITVENNFDGNPDTGVLLDTLPYLILLAVAVAGGVLVVVRKRKHRDE